MSQHPRYLPVVLGTVMEDAKAGGILVRRLDLPEEAFISVEELEEMFGEGHTDVVSCQSLQSPFAG